jgi:hypothetical protein
MDRISLFVHLIAAMQNYSPPMMQIFAGKQGNVRWNQGRIFVIAAILA